MVYCDTNENVLEWSNEEMFVWYRSPLDNKPHRYFPDFLIKVKEETKEATLAMDEFLVNLSDEGGKRYIKTNDLKKIPQRLADFCSLRLDIASFSIVFCCH